MINNTMPPKSSVYTHRAPPVAGAWQQGVFDCSNDIGTCLLSCICPCVVYGQMKSKLDRTSCFMNGCIYAIVANIGCYCFLTGLFRGQVRRTYGIPGGSFEDCLIHCFCSPCAMTQEKLEIDARS